MGVSDWTWADVYETDEPARDQRGLTLLPVPPLLDCEEEYEGEEYDEEEP